MHLPKHIKEQVVNLSKQLFEAGKAFALTDHPQAKLHHFERAQIIHKKLREITENYRIVVEEQKRQQFEHDHRIIHLECVSSECKFAAFKTNMAYGIAVHAKDYVLDEIKCENCGEPLKSKDDLNVYSLLDSLGIYF